MPTYALEEISTEKLCALMGRTEPRDLYDIHLDDPRLPSRLRPLVSCAIAYFILPAEIIPEEIYGPYGYVDDIFLCAFVADQVREQAGMDEILTEHGM